MNSGNKYLACFRKCSLFPLPSLISKYCCCNVFICYKYVFFYAPIPLKRKLAAVIDTAGTKVKLPPPGATITDVI